VPRCTVTPLRRLRLHGLGQLGGGPGARDGGQPGLELRGVGRVEPLGGEKFFGAARPGQQDLPGGRLDLGLPEDQHAHQRGAMTKFIPDLVPDLGSLEAHLSSTFLSSTFL